MLALFCLFWKWWLPPGKLPRHGHPRHLNSPSLNAILQLSYSRPEFMPFQPTTSALNHLLNQNSWALSRLVRFAGKTLRFDIAPFSFTYTISENGMLRVPDSDSRPDAHCAIAPSLLPRLALKDDKAHSEILCEGDAALLAEIFFLSRNLVWDAADDLSHFTGDIVAERIVEATKNAHIHYRGAAMNFSQATAEYWTEEHPLLAMPQQVSAFMHQVDTLRDDMARLQQRISRLSATKIS